MDCNIILVVWNFIRMLPKECIKKKTSYENIVFIFDPIISFCLFLKTLLANLRYFFIDQINENGPT